MVDNLAIVSPTGDHFLSTCFLPYYFVLVVIETNQLQWQKAITHLSHELVIVG